MINNTRRSWSQNELFVAFRLYCRTPFGKLHQRNPDIISLANHLGRTPSAVAMKACNFAAFDPKMNERGISGLPNASRADRDLWTAFSINPTQVAEDVEAAYTALVGKDELMKEEHLQTPNGPTEIERMVKVRRVQSFFRAAVLSSYDFRCAISNMEISELLVASHIIPWRMAIDRRADPKNGIALNALYDCAFDRGFITFDDSFRAVLSPRLKPKCISPFHTQAFDEIEGRQLRLPYRFEPDSNALAFHRDNIFLRT